MEPSEEEKALRKTLRQARTPAEIDAFAAACAPIPTLETLHHALTKPSRIRPFLLLSPWAHPKLPGVVSFLGSILALWVVNHRPWPEGDRCLVRVAERLPADRTVLPLLDLARIADR